MTGLGRRAFNRRGVASVEAALVLPLVLVPLMMGMIGVGTALSTASRLDGALHAAIFHAWANAASYTAASVQQAAQAAYGTASPALTVGASTACSCVTSSYVKASTVNCAGTCPNGQALAAYLTISASATLQAVPGLAASLPITASGTVRVK